MPEKQPEHVQAPNLNTALATRLQDAVLGLPFPVVLLGWLAVYTAVGLLFFAIYATNLMALHGAMPATWRDALSFSFVTQATIGYGDFSPAGWWRLFANVQAVIGTGLNGIALGLITFRMLRRGVPIRAANAVSFQMLSDGKFSFRLRYISVDTRDLVDVIANVFFITNARHRNARYDTYGGCVREMPLVTVPPMVTFALDVPTAPKGEALDGDDVEAAHNDRVIPLHPSMFLIGGEVDPDSRLLLRIRGYHSSTGELFSFVREYRAGEIHCRRFDTIDNNDVGYKPFAERRKVALGKLNRLLGVPRGRCPACNGIARCPFGPQPTSCENQG